MVLFLKVEHDAYWLIEPQPLGLLSYFLQTDEQQNLCRGSKGSIYFKGPGITNGIVNQKSKVKYNEVVSFGLSEYGVHLSQPCKAKKMSRRAGSYIWSKAGSST